MSHGQDCLFCKMGQGLIAVPKVYEDDAYFCIRDIRPQAKAHLLVIPKSHMASVVEAFPEGVEGEVSVIGGLFQLATQIARTEGLASEGFRLVLNTGANAGQTVFHLHLHLLGGELLDGGFGSYQRV